MDFDAIQKNQKFITQNQPNSDGENYYCKSKETFKETEYRANNNFSKASKTEAKSSQSHNGISLFEDANYVSENLQSETFLTKCFVHKKAIDLTIHNRTIDGGVKTIFDDAEYFSKHYSYKLLPINFENVDETIIHNEHNYCHLTLSSGSEAEDECSRTMDYNQIKEKNYKKRKTKSKQERGNHSSGDNESQEYFYEMLHKSNFSENQQDSKSDLPVSALENSSSTQPLDLSAPLVQEEKTDHYLREHESSIVNSVSKIDEVKDDSVHFDSDKENHKSHIKCVEVTITRPDEKENYQPCDVFLNDIARLIPKLVEKDCSKVDIMDHTCDQYINFQKNRLYYIISESTWQLFQNANERIILTNDQSLGNAVQKIDTDKKPTYLVFDQYSLAKCLADYCKEIGGCFEYTCLEEHKDEVVESSLVCAEQDLKKVEENELITNEESKEVMTSTFPSKITECLKENINHLGISNLIEHKGLLDEYSCENVVDFNNIEKKTMLESNNENCDCKVWKEKINLKESNGLISCVEEHTKENVTTIQLETLESQKRSVYEKQNEKIILGMKNNLRSLKKVVNKKVVQAKKNLNVKSRKKESKRKSPEKMEIKQILKTKNQTTKLGKIVIRKCGNKSNINSLKENTQNITRKRSRSKSACEPELKNILRSKVVTSQKNDEVEGSILKGMKRERSASESLTRNKKKIDVQKRPKICNDKDKDSTCRVVDKRKLRSEERTKQSKKVIKSETKMNSEKRKTNTKWKKLLEVQGKKGSKRNQEKQKEKQNQKKNNDEKSKEDKKIIEGQKAKIKKDVTKKSVKTIKQKKSNRKKKSNMKKEEKKVTKKNFKSEDKKKTLDKGK